MSAAVVREALSRLTEQGLVQSNPQRGFIVTPLPAGIGHFSVTSTDVRAGRPVPQRFWGCTDPGVSPELSWPPVPGARGYAVTVFDPDAPTGSGFWHWIA